jgi:hypothetical protein
MTVTGADGREHELTLAEEWRAVERRHPGWRLWPSDTGKPWATRTPDARGQEATVGADHITLMDHEIALHEHREGVEARMRVLMGEMA